MLNTMNNNKKSVRMMNADIGFAVKPMLICYINIGFLEKPMLM